MRRCHGNAIGQQYPGRITHEGTGQRGWICNGYGYAAEYVGGGQKYNTLQRRPSCIDYLPFSLGAPLAGTQCAECIVRMSYRAQVVNRRFTVAINCVDSSATIQLL